MLIGMEPRASVCDGVPLRRSLPVSAGHRRYAIVTTAVVGTWLIPWSALLATSLPSTTRVHHWAISWVGLDLAEAASAVGTAVFLRRNDRRAALSAVILASLLCCDAWFDVCT